MSTDSGDLPKSRVQDVVFSRRSESSSPGKSPDPPSHRSTTSAKQPSIDSNDGSSRPSSQTAGGFLIDQPGPSTMKDRAIRYTAFPRMSGESGRLGSPLSQELSVEDASPHMDPAQLVQMALDLSESRRRHGNRAVQPSIAKTELTPRYGSLRSRHSPSPRQDDHASQGSSHSVFNPSPATLSRAERARRYFELAAQHRKILDSSNCAYNPLKTLRNRQQRANDDYAFPAESWVDVDAVKEWIDGMNGSFDVRKHPVPLLKQSSHRRTDTASSVLVRSESFWSVEPSELFEDLCWTELKATKELEPRASVDRERTSEDAGNVLSESDYDTQGEGRRNLLLRRRKRHRSRSVATISSEGSRARDVNDINIGPLERHMKEIMKNGSPENSPDYWDHLPPPQESRPEPIRSNSASGRPRAVTVTSMTSEELNPPPMPTFLPRTKSKLHRLPMFKSKEVEPVDNFDGPTRHSLDLPRPVTGRHRTTESLGGGPSDGDTTSSMQRLFKGGRLGDYVRHEGARLRKKPVVKQEEEEKSSSENEENLQAIDFGKKQKYYLPDLPSFTSKKRSNEATPADSTSELPALTTIESRRHWSISDRVPTTSSSSVTAKEVARVRALLLASGIKASELIKKQKREEKEIGQRLSQQIDASLNSAEASLRSQQEVAQSLTERIDKLLERASILLTHDATEQADQFTAELMSKAPQDIRRLDDAINQMLRRQRRQFRVVRRTGFKMLEIFLVLMFRFLWLIFMLFTSIRNAIVLAFKVVKWLVVF